MPLQEKIKSLEQLFCPRNVAVFGVSTTNPGSYGTMFVKANMDAGFVGNLYPIQPKGGQILGLQTYRNLADIPDKIDLACIAVPADAVLSVLEECLEQGVAGVQILSSGFRELGTEQGTRLEAAVAEFAMKGLRIIGPNCFGIHCPSCGLTLLPGGGFSRKPGPVAFFGQSGGLAVDLGYGAPGMGFGWRRMVSYGNGCDVDAAELLECFADDPECSVISGYIEGVPDGQRFLAALQRACLKKPVVLWKAGLTETGSRAVMSHTGSLGGSARVWQSAMKQAGATMVSSQEEFLDVITAFLNLGQWTGNGIAVVGGGGALGVASADAAERYGLSFPEFELSTQAAMEQLLPPVGTSLKNPADVGNPMVPPDIIGPLIQYAARDPNIDAVILIQIIHHITYITRMYLGQPDLPLEDLSYHETMAQTCRSVQAATGVPVLQVLPPVSSDTDKMEVERVLRKARSASNEAGVPTYPNINRAISAISRVAAYWNWRHAQQQRRF